MKRSKLAAMCLVLTLAAGAAARGADAPAAKPFMQASVASADRVKQAIADLGIPIPFDLGAMVERQFTFIGDGGLDTGKPIGLTFLAGEELTQAQFVIFALPVTKESATIESFTGKGGVLVPGETDMVTLGDQVAFKRTADYLFMYPGDAALLKNSANNPFGKDYKSKEVLAHVEIDAAAARLAAPNMYKAFKESIVAGASKRPATNAAEELGQQWAKQFIANLFDKVEKTSATLLLNDQSLRFSAMVSPSPLKGKREFAKPVFAPGTIASVHVVYPDAESASWLSLILKAIPDENLPVESRKLTPAQVAQEREALAMLAGTCVGDAQSIAVEDRGGSLVVTVVNQYQRNVNAPADLKKSIEMMNELDEKAGRTKSELVPEEWKGADGTTGVKIKGPTFEAVVVQKGKTAIATISDKPITVPSSVTLSPTEKISDLISVRLDLTAVIKLAADKGALPPEQQKMFAEKLAGKQVSLNVSNNAAGAMVVDASIPVDLVKILPQAVMGAMSPRAQRTDEELMVPAK